MLPLVVDAVEIKQYIPFSHRANKNVLQTWRKGTWKQNFWQLRFPLCLCWGWRLAEGNKPSRSHRSQSRRFSRPNLSPRSQQHHLLRQSRRRSQSRRKSRGLSRSRRMTRRVKYRACNCYNCTRGCICPNRNALTGASGNKIARICTHCSTG